MHVIGQLRRNHFTALGKKGSAEGEMSPSSPQSDEAGSPSTATGWGTLQEAAASSELQWATCVDCKGGKLCFQYFEKQRPHVRLPFCDQVSPSQSSVAQCQVCLGCDIAWILLWRTMSA